MKRPIKWGTVIFMIVTHILAVVALLPQFWSWSAAAALVVLYWLTACLGVTLGYHRLLAHRSFVVPQWLERFFATCGALSVQRGPIDWVGLHRQHHKFADTDRDPHDSRKGFWWCHFGWMLLVSPNDRCIPSYSKDLKDPYYTWLNNWFLVPQILLALTLYLIGGWGCVLWGIPLRLVLVYHATWLVNSATHFWGVRRFDTGDDALNNWWVALVTFGEGFHNNHHAYPHSAKQGYINEIDLTWQHIRLLMWAGLATRVKGVL